MQDVRCSAIQVTASLLDAKTKLCEHGPLQRLASQALTQGLRRMVLTYDTVGLGTIDGIEVVNAVNRLLS